MSHRAWRSLHYFGYAVWGLSLIHGVPAGTDSRSPFALAVYGTSAAIVGGAAWYRWVERPAARRSAAPRRASGCRPARRSRSRGASHEHAPDMSRSSGTASPGTPAPAAWPTAASR